MDIVTVRRQFEAFAAGGASEQDLRQALTDAVTADPHLAPAYVALTNSYLRGSVDEQRLRDVLLTEIEQNASRRDSAAQAAEKSAVSPADFEVTGTPANASNWADRQSAATTLNPGRSARARVPSTGTGSGWDSLDRLNEPAVPLVPGSVLKNRYELQSELGRGGMGVVYKALDRANAEFKDRSPFVAVKVLNDEFKRHPLAMRALARESKKALKLAHPNIVTVYNFSRDGGNAFMVMELLDGLSLDQLLEVGGSAGLPPERAISILRSLGEALSYAHEQGIVHADFKPSNAFITTGNVVKVLDFGIARAAQDQGAGGEKTAFDVSELHAISPTYASVEMLNGEPPDVRDDVYALGCVTYELFTGRHPFNRIEATKARDANLQPAPIRGMPRRQWAALRRALSFSRAERTPSVAALVSAFDDPSRSRIWIGALVGVAVIAAIAAIAVPRQLESYRAHQEAASIAAAQGSAMAGALSKLRAAPTRFREQVLLDEKARTAILSFYQAQVEALTTPPNYEFPKAFDRLDELRALLPDSTAVATLTASLQSRADTVLKQLTEQADRAVQRSVLIPEQGSGSLIEVLTLIQQVKPTSKFLADPNIPRVFGFSAKQALDANHTELAHQLVSAGLKVVPNDKTLLALNDQVDQETQRLANIRRQGELEQRLSSINTGSSNFLQKITDNREDLTALQALAPDSPVGRRIESALESVVALRVKQYLDGSDVAGAQTLMLSVGDLLPDAAALAERDLIQQAATANQSKSLDTLERLRRAVLAGRLEKTGSTGALDLYAQLERSGAGSVVLADARDFLAYGYLKQARRARMDGKLQLAASTLEKGRGYKPNPTIQAMLAAEQGEWDQASKASGGAKVAPPDLDSARAQFAQSLRASTLNEHEISTIALSLDRLDELGAPPRELSSGISEVENRVLQEMQHARQQPGVDPAPLIEQASIMLPASDRLAEANKAIREAAAAGDLKSRLQALLTQPAASESWAAQVRGLVQNLRPVLPVGDPVFADARQIPAKTFLQAAAAARSEGHAADEKKWLSTAREFDPNARLDAAPAAVRASSSAPDTPSAEQTANTAAQAQAIESLKQRLQSQAESGDVAGAEKTASSLRAVLAGTIYVARELPDALVAAYVRKAKDLRAAGKLHDAQQTLTAGAREFPNDGDIKALQAKYTQEQGEADAAAKAGH